MKTQTKTTVSPKRYKMTTTKRNKKSKKRNEKGVVRRQREGVRRGREAGGRREGVGVAVMVVSVDIRWVYVVLLLLSFITYSVYLQVIYQTYTAHTSPLYYKCTTQSRHPSEAFIKKTDRSQLRPKMNY